MYKHLDKERQKKLVRIMQKVEKEIMSALSIIVMSPVLMGTLIGVPSAHL